MYKATVAHSKKYTILKFMFIFHSSDAQLAPPSFNKSNALKTVTCEHTRRDLQISFPQASIENPLKVCGSKQWLSVCSRSAVCKLLLTFMLCIQVQFQQVRTGAVNKPHVCSLWKSSRTWPTRMTQIPLPTMFYSWEFSLDIFFFSLGEKQVFLVRM